MKIIIDFDTVTQKVISVTTDEGTFPVNVETENKKKRVKKEKIEDDSLTVLVGDNKLILTSKLVEKLEVKEGDRLAIMYKESDGFIEPFLGKADLFTGAGGNKLTKSLSISFRGDQRESLLKFGNKFEIEAVGDGSVKLISSVKVKKPEQTLITDLPKEIQDILMAEDEKLDLDESLFNL